MTFDTGYTIKHAYRQRMADGTSVTIPEGTRHVLTDELAPGECRFDGAQLTSGVPTAFLERERAKARA